MKLTIYHSVNAALYLWNGKSGLLVDFLHGGKEHGFSDVPEPYIHMMRRKEKFFRFPNDLLLTHRHEDHYDQALTEEYLSLYPLSLLYCPEYGKSNVKTEQIKEGIIRFRMKEYTIYAFTTVHDGKQYQEEPHCSYLVQYEDQRIWISGDGHLDAQLGDRVATVCGSEPMDAVFVMVYQIGSGDGRMFLRQLPSKKIYLYHMPYKTDDGFHFYRMADYLIRKCQKENISIDMLQSDRFVPL